MLEIMKNKVKKIQSFIKMTIYRQKYLKLKYIFFPE